MTARLPAAVLAAAVLLAVTGSSTAPASAAPGEPAPPTFWTPLPQPASERTGIWTACTGGVRLFLAEGSPQSGPSITSQPDPSCAGGAR